MDEYTAAVTTEEKQQQQQQHGGEAAAERPQWGALSLHWAAMGIGVVDDDGSIPVSHLRDLSRHLY